MKIKIIMDSGKVYTSELDTSISAFLERMAKLNKSSLNHYIPLDTDGHIVVSVTHISSVEAIE